MHETTTCENGFAQNGLEWFAPDMYVPHKHIEGTLAKDSQGCTCTLVF